MTLSNTIKSKDDKKKLKEIYISSFPSYERMPFFRLTNSSKKDKGFELLSIYDNETVIGFFYVILQKDICLILYFAIDEDKRSLGFGSQAITLIKEHFIGKRIFLYIEQIKPKAQNYEQQVKRKDFYVRNNFRPTNFQVVLSTEVFEVLIYGNEIEKEEYIQILRKMTGGINFAKVVDT